MYGATMKDRSCQPPMDSSAAPDIRQMMALSFLKLRSSRDFDKNKMSLRICGCLLDDVLPRLDEMVVVGMVSLGIASMKRLVVLTVAAFCLATPTFAGINNPVRRLLDKTAMAQMPPELRRPAAIIPLQMQRAETDKEGLAGTRATA